MKKKFISISLLFALLVSLAAGLLLFAQIYYNSDTVKAEQLLAVNELQQLAKSGETALMEEKAELLRESIRADVSVFGDIFPLLVLSAACLFLMAVFFIYIYFAVILPFDKMKEFAENISKGNFDFPLEYRRSNYFGSFTWAFDSMRREITKARSGEKEAIENNKTVIATLSHDIKTPISSIRAYAEGLEANMDTTPEKREKYLSVIMSKCDEVSRLTNDLFLHSLSDMDKLKITPENLELTAFMEQAAAEIGEERNDLHYKKPDFTVTVYVDRNRLMQLTENLINNSRKYAKTDIDIFITKNENEAEIHFLDGGEGIPDEDMPFIFGKFYRGRNCGDEQGSGLGLYIAEYIVKQSKGKILLHNRQQGLEVIVSLPLVL